MNALAIFQTNSDVEMTVGKQPNTDAERAAVANAIAAPTHKMSAMINKQMEIVNYYLEKIWMPDKDGEVRETLRVVLIDTNGESYGCVARGVANALKSVVLMYGTPDKWEHPLTIEVQQVAMGKGNMLTFRVIPEPPS